VDSVKNVLKITIGLVLFTRLAFGFYGFIGARGTSAQTEKESRSPLGFDGVDRHDAERMMKEGQETFRFDTFGDETFWGDTLKLHQAIEGAKLGGVGPGVSPATALSVGPKSGCGRTACQPYNSPEARKGRSE
jgi:hypothetical protein